MDFHPYLFGNRHFLAQRQFFQEGQYFQGGAEQNTKRIFFLRPRAGLIYIHQPTTSCSQLARSRNSSYTHNNYKIHKAQKTSIHNNRRYGIF